jgi:hypothetical protein
MGRKTWIVLMWITTGSGGGILRTRQRTSGSMKGNEFLDQMSDYQLAKESGARTQIRRFFLCSLNDYDSHRQRR